MHHTPLHKCKPKSEDTNCCSDAQSAHSSNAGRASANTHDARSTYSSESRKKKKIHFDENNLRETYHPENKDYGHMKIDEPDTPFERTDDSQRSYDKSQAVDPEELRQKLLELKRAEESEELSESASHESDFARRRRQHYDEEYRRAKQMEKQHALNATDSSEASAKE